MREAAWGKGGYGEERFDSKSDLEFFVGWSVPKGVGNQSFLAKQGKSDQRCAWHARISLRVSP